MEIQRRDCKDEMECPLKYKVLKCVACKKFRVMVANEHNHPLNDQYDNVNGLHRFIKSKVLELLEKGKTKAKQVHSYLTIPKTSRVLKYHRSISFEAS